MIIIPGLQYSPAWWELRREIPTASNAKQILTAVGKQCTKAADHDGDCSAEPPEKCPEKAGRRNCRLPKGHPGEHSGEDLPRCQVMLPQLSAGMKAYARELYGERTNLSVPFFSDRGTGRPLSQAQQNGIDTEAEARKWLATFGIPPGKDGRRAAVEEVAFCCSDDGRFGFSPDGMIPNWQIGIELKCPEYDTHVAWVGDWLENQTMPTEHIQQVQASLAISGARCWLFVSYNPDFQDYPGVVMPIYPNGYTAHMIEALEEFWAEYRRVIATYTQQPAEEVEMPSVLKNIERLRREGVLEHEPIQVDWRKAAEAAA